MNSIKKIAISSLLFLVLSIAVASLVNAESPSVNPRVIKEENRCEKITANLNGRVTSAQARISAREAYVAKRKEQIQKRISELQAKGADVTKLQSDFTQFSSLLDKWLADYKTYVADLQAAQNLSCTTSREKFKAALETARTQHKVVREDREAIRNFYQNTLKPDFKTTRQSIKTVKSTATPAR